MEQKLMPRKHWIKDYAPQHYKRIEEIMIEQMGEERTEDMLNNPCSRPNALTSAFTWGATTEGRKFWFEVHKAISDGKLAPN